VLLVFDFGLHREGKESESQLKRKAKQIRSIAGRRNVPSATPQRYCRPLTVLPSCVATSSVLPIIEKGIAAFYDRKESQRLYLRSKLWLRYVSKTYSKDSSMLSRRIVVGIDRRGIDSDLLSRDNFSDLCSAAVLFSMQCNLAQSRA
jgi:hypothetical protein